MHENLVYKLLISVLSILFGALLAFGFNRKLKNIDLLEEKKSRCRLSAYILYKQYEGIMQFFDDFLLPFKEHSYREEVIAPVKFRSESCIVDISSISFLLTTDDPYTLHGISCLQDRYQTIVDIINDRHDLHMRIQADIKSTWEPGSLGEYDSTHLKIMTDALFEHIPEFVEAYFISKDRFEKRYELIFKEKGPLVYGEKS